MTATPRETLDLGAVVLEAAPRLEQRIAGAPVAVSEIAQGAQVVAHRPQLVRLLEGLADGAARRAPSGGVVLSTRAVDASAELALSHGSLRPGSYVALVVAHAGWPLGGEEIAHLFDPFAGVEPGGGPGGLALAYGIAKANGWAIDVRSGQQATTSIIVYLPRADATSSA